MAIAQNVLARIQADALRRAGALANRDVRSFNLHVHHVPVKGGQPLRIGMNSVADIQRDSVLVLADLAPQWNWGHPCEHMLYDAHSGDHYATHIAEFPPGTFFNAPEQYVAFHSPVHPIVEREPILRKMPSALDRVLSYKTTGQRYAILFSGMSNNRHLNDLEFMYRTLIDIYQFNPLNIITLNWNGSLSYSGGPQPPRAWPGDNTNYRVRIDGAGSKVQLAAALKSMATRLGKDDLLFVHSNNHGGGQPYDPEAWLCCYPNWDSCTATDFGRLLATFPPFGSLIVMMEQCHSGGFREAVLNNSRASGTSFAAACAADASSMGGADFDPFAKDWIAAMADRNPNGAPLSQTVSAPASALDAFNYARTVKAPGDSPLFADGPAGVGGSQTLFGRKASLKELAYGHWEARGRPAHDDWSDWFWAERQLQNIAYSHWVDRGRPKRDDWNDWFWAEKKNQPGVGAQL